MKTNAFSATEHPRSNFLSVMTLVGGALLALWLVCGQTAYAASRAALAATAAPSLEVKEVSLGELWPQPYKAVINETIRQSSDYRHVAFSAKQGDKMVVYLDGVPSPEYDSVGIVRFWPGGDQVAYVASRSNKWFVVSKGIEGKSYERVGYDQQRFWPFVFSPDGLHLSYVAAEGGKGKVVVDGQEGPSYDEIVPPTAFSPDSKRIAYYGRRADRTVAVLDSKEVAEGEAMAGKHKFEKLGLWFSPDGRRFACAIQKAGKEYVVVDGVQSQPWDEISRGMGHGFPEGDYGGVRFSPDSKHFVYEAKRNDSYSIVVDGVEKVRGGYVGCLTFSPDSRRTAYVRITDEDPPDQCKTAVVVDGVMGKPFDGSIEKLLFSPDGKRLLYIGRRGQGVEFAKEFVVVNGIAGKDYDHVESSGEPETTGPIFSADSRHFAYVAERGEPGDAKGFLVIDGKKAPLKAGIVMVMDDAVFSPRHGRWAYILSRDENYFVVFNGTRMGPYDCIQNGYTSEGHVVFSPDGRHAAVPAQRGREGILVVDGIERKIDGSWLPISDLVFDSPTHLHGLILRRYQLLRLEVDVNAGRRK